MSRTGLPAHRMGDAITRVQHDTGSPAGSVQGQHGLNGHVHGGHVERLEHDLHGSHKFNVSTAVNVVPHAFAPAAFDTLARPAIHRVQTHDNRI